MVVAPVRGWRHVEVTDQRTQVDWADAICHLVDGHYPEAEPIVLGLDNRTTHVMGSLSDAFPPAEARPLVEQLELHSTPKHGSWRTRAEIELRVLSQQCLDRRIATRAELEREVTAWEQERNARCGTINWRFTTADARIKLKHLYPSLEP